MHASLKSLAAVAAVCLLVACGRSSTVDGGTGTDGAHSVIKVLSNRADLISGGDALVEVVPPPGVDAAAMKMALNGRDVSGQFAPTAEGTLRGLVTGLVLGRNVFTAQSPKGRASATLVNHPNGGPIIAGPQLQP
ncbi:MAG: DUF6351 family protein, partial [Solimonas sp.]